MAQAVFIIAGLARLGVSTFESRSNGYKELRLTDGIPAAG